MFNKKILINLNCLRVVEIQNTFEGTVRVSTSKGKISASGDYAHTHSILIIESIK